MHFYYPLFIFLATITNFAHCEESSETIVESMKEVEGKSATDSDELRRFYSYHNVDNMVKRVWNRMGTKSLTLEFKVFPAMNPKDYANQFDLINAAHKQVQEFVAPNQTEVKKGVIPYNG